MLETGGSRDGDDEVLFGRREDGWDQELVHHMFWG